MIYFVFLYIIISNVWYLVFLQEEYISLVSQFKLEQCVAEETRSFCEGFWQVCLVNSE